MKGVRKAFIFPLLILTVLSIALAVGNIQQRLTWKLPYDGVAWRTGENGIITARSVDPESPGAAAGMRQDDILVRINGTDVYSLPEKERLIWTFPHGQEVGYTILRNGELKEMQVRMEWRTMQNEYYVYLSAVGWTTLSIGLFILFRRPDRRFALHFYILALCIFVFSVFSYTGKFNTLDWMVYWGDLLARLLFPTVLLHLALRFPGKALHSEIQRTFFPRIAYIPFFALLLVNIFFKNVSVHFDLFPGVIDASLLSTLDLVNLIYFSVMISISFGILFVSGRRSVNIISQKQMRWILWGSTAGFIPFCLVYVPLYLLGTEIPFVAKLSILGLILVPLSFATSITKFRLMDVEIIFKKGTVFLFSFTVVVAISYIGLLALSLVFPELRAESFAGAILFSVVIIALLYYPIRESLQNLTDRIFYKERYYFRKTISGFARELAAENDIQTLLKMLVERISHTLGIRKIVVFLKTPDPGRYHTFTKEKSFSDDSIALSSRVDRFLEPVLEKKNILFLEDVLADHGVFRDIRETFIDQGIYYLIPCRYKGKINALIGLGRKERNNNLLSSEDMDLLNAIIGPVAIAIENAALYKTITDQVELYRRLKNYNENIIESIHAGVLVLGEGEEIEGWNTAFTEIYGKESAGAEGKTLQDVFPPDLAGIIRNLIRTQGSGIEDIPEVTKVSTRNARGKEIVVNIAASPMRGGAGEACGNVIIFNDITGQVELENMLVQSEKMASIGLLAAGVAHEVNTPITGISSFAQILENRFQEGSYESELLKKIQAQSHRAAEIVNNLLNFSRLHDHDFTELDLNQLIEETLSLFQPQVRGRQINIIKKFPPAIPHIRGDKGKLQQVFLNFFLNAKDAMPSGGDLIITTRRVNASVMASVCDTGIGIPAEDLNKIYDPFFTTKKFGAGTGLGLSICYGIIKEHSGFINVKSSRDRGTCFEIRLPVGK